MTIPMPNKTPLVGHVHLKVADLDRSIAFYCDVLGFEVTQRSDSAAFLGAGGYDRAEGEWPRDAHGSLAMVNKRLDVAALVAEGRSA